MPAKIKKPDPTDELVLSRWLRDNYPCPTCDGFGMVPADNMYGVKHCADCHPSRPGVRHPDDTRPP